MQRLITLTKDGSHTISIPAMSVTYHSQHGAIQESEHVFIAAGLKHFHATHAAPAIRIFEMGFGTGLNALLTYIAAGELNTKVEYTALELYPLEKDYIDSLNYPDQLNRQDLAPIFIKMHTSDWNKPQSLFSSFSFRKIQADLVTWNPDQRYDLIYYDAFAPAAQPQLWTADIFMKLNAMLAGGGILVTYCSKGDVRRAMQTAGFIVTKIPGPPGKREMVRAIKQ